MNWVLSTVQEFMAFAKANPWIGLPLTAWILGIATYATRNVPKALYRFIKAQTTTTLIFDTSYNVGHQGTFEELMTWFSDNKYANLSRVVRVYFRWTGEDGVKPWERVPVAGMSEASQFIVWEGMPALISCQRLGNDNSLLSDSTPYVVTIIRLGRDRNSLMRMIEEFRQRAVREKPVRRKLVGTDWMIQGSIRHRPIDTVVTNDNIVEEIIERIRKFEQNEKWYLDHGIPYKLCFCLHGPPGTGKNSVIRAVSYALGRGIDSVSLNMTNDFQLATALSGAAGSKAFIFFDDFDDVKFHARSESLRAAIEHAPKLEEAPVNAPMATATLEERPRPEEKKTGVSRQGLLSILDGEDTPHGRVFFLTTNDMTNLDSAIVRPGRVDKHFYVGLLNNDSIQRYIVRQYGQQMKPLVENIRFAEVAGSELEGHYKQHPHDLYGLMDSLAKESEPA